MFALAEMPVLSSFAGIADPQMKKFVPLYYPQVLKA
jgi:hypothetical protein